MLSALYGLSKPFSHLSTRQKNYLQLFTLFTSVDFTKSSDDSVGTRLALLAQNKINDVFLCLFSLNHSDNAAFRDSVTVANYLYF